MAKELAGIYSFLGLGLFVNRLVLFSELIFWCSCFLSGGVGRTTFYKQRRVAIFNIV